jgi:ectoine hydroxylase
MMLPDDIWKFAPEAMTEAERDRFFEDGCLVLENAIAADWLARLRAAVDEMIERS